MFKMAPLLVAAAAAPCALLAPATGSAATAQWQSVASVGLAPGYVAVVAATEGADGKAYFLRHCLHFSCKPSPTEVYNGVTNRWSTVAAVPHTFSKGYTAPFAAVTGSAGKIYAVGAGGYQDQTGLHANDLLLSFSTATNSWTQKAPLPQQRAQLGAAPGADGLIYAMGGAAGDPRCLLPQSSNAVYAYNPTSNTWAQETALPQARDSFAAVLGPDQRIYAIAGEDQVVTYPSQGSCQPTTTYLATVDAYSFSTHSWTAVASFPSAGPMLGAVAGSDGRIYALSSGAAGAPTFAAFSPSSNAWSALASPPHGSAQSAAALLGMSGVRLASGRVGVLVLDDVCTSSSSCSVKSYVYST